MAALIGAVLACGAVFVVSKRATAGVSDMQAMVAALWAGVAAWVGYLLYAVGWLPGSTAVQMKGWVWAAGAVTFAGGMLTLLWRAWKREI